MDWFLLFIKFLMTENSFYWTYIKRGLIAICFVHYCWKILLISCFKVLLYSIFLIDIEDWKFPLLYIHIKEAWLISTLCIVPENPITFNFPNVKLYLIPVLYIASTLRDKPNSYYLLYINLNQAWLIYTLCIVPD